MTVKNAELVRRFLAFNSKGSAGRMTMEELEDGSIVVVGYPNRTGAIYAHHDKETFENGPGEGEVTVYTGWKGRSSTTTRHVELIRRKAIDPIEVDDERPKFEHGRPQGAQEVEPPY